MFKFDEYIQNWNFELITTELTIKKDYFLYKHFPGSLLFKFVDFSDC